MRSVEIRAIEEGLGKKAVIEYLPSNPSDMHDTSTDISKAHRLLAWRPELVPGEGLYRTTEWHLANGRWLDAICL